MSNHPKQAVRLAPQPVSGGSKIRTRFNTLVRQLEEERKRLAGWHDALPKARARADQEMTPLVKQYNERMRDMVVLLDDGWENRKLTKKESITLSDAIIAICEQVLDDRDDDLIDEIYAKHTGFDEGLEDLDHDPDYLAFKEAFGAELDELFDQIGNPQDSGDQDMDLGSLGEQAAARPRKASAKDARQAAEEAHLKQSVREIFRKLASSLHPDRETDPAERDRKNVLMQRANVAYAADDLLGLLELQFEIAQIDQAALESQGDARIQQYNKVLDKQLKEVRREIAELENMFAFQLNLSGHGRITPATVERGILEEIEQMKRNIAGMEEDLVSFKESKPLKAFLKARARMAADGYGADDVLGYF